MMPRTRRRRRAVRALRSVASVLVFAAVALGARRSALAAAAPTTAPAGYDQNVNNGFDPTFDKDRDGFEEIEHICPDGEKVKGGLGPVYNDTACANCHQNPISGSAGQTLEIRAGFTIANLPGHSPALIFAEPTGGSLIHQRATDARIQEHVPVSDPQAPGGTPVRTLRLTTNILGDGFVEVLPDEDILGYQAQQPANMIGLGIAVPVAINAKGPDGKPVLVDRIGRFGWKCQEASLLNFSAGAYLNEMGITSLLNANEDKSNGQFVGQLPYDPVPELEDESDAEAAQPHHPFGEDVEAFTRFMRSTSAPPQGIPDGVDPADVRRGEALFGTDNANDGVFGTPKGTAGLGCVVCHRASYVTPEAGSLIHMLRDPAQPGSDIKDLKDASAQPSHVPTDLGSKIIFPYSDFMLHNIGTGDGIAQTQHAQDPPTNFENRRRLLSGEAIAHAPGAPARRYNIAVLERRRSPAAASAAASRPASSGPAEPGRLLIERPHPATTAPAAPGAAAGAAPAGAIGAAGAAGAPPELDQRVRNMIRTAPLWGLRTRAHLLHDGSALTVDEAIRRHHGQADQVEEAYEALSDQEQKQLLAFLNTMGFGPRQPCPPPSAHPNASGTAKP